MTSRMTAGDVDTTRATRNKSSSTRAKVTPPSADTLRLEGNRMSLLGPIASTVSPPLDFPIVPLPGPKTADPLRDRRVGCVADVATQILDVRVGRRDVARLHRHEFADRLPADRLLDQPHHPGD